MEKAMNGDIRTAKDALLKNGYTCVLHSDGEEFHSDLRGVRPLIDFLESGKDFHGFSAADKTVGLGAAHVYILLGVKAVWAKVMSRAAKELLEKNRIEAFCDEEVPYIINRQGNGKCPIESAVIGITDPTEALKTIKETLADLK